MPPSAFCATTFSASSVADIPSCAATYCRWWIISATVMRWKSYTWQRLRMVGSTLCFSVVARMKIAYEGGSSSVFKRALNAPAESMCTSSMIYTLYLPICGGIRTWSIKLRMSSTELLDAASSSWILNDRCSLNAVHDSHWLQASCVEVGFWQLIVLANMRAQVVLPTPRGPQNRYACANLPWRIELRRVSVSACCPTTLSNVVGLYFRAETIYLLFSI